MIRRPPKSTRTDPLVPYTTLFRSGLLSALGLEEEAPSPSFAIVQPYDPPLVRFPVTHVDLYRLENAAEAEELALDELLCDSLLLIEWPERLGATLWPHSQIGRAHV